MRYKVQINNFDGVFEVLEHVRRIVWAEKQRIDRARFEMPVHCQHTYLSNVLQKYGKGEVSRMFV